MWNILAIVIALIALGILVRYLIRHFDRPRRKRKLKARIERFVQKRLRALKDPQFLAVGNVGTVFQAALHDNWKEELGIQWCTEVPIPERIIIKFRYIYPKLKDIPPALLALAPELDCADPYRPSHDMCPYLAIGFVEDPDLELLVAVEIMPLLDGEILEGKIKREKLDPETTLPELIKMLTTVTFLEEKGFYTRNLDSGNVMVFPDGSWIRIDFDSAVMAKKFPLGRMIRLARLSRQVLRNIDWESKPENYREVMRLINRTRKAPLAKWERKGIPVGKESKIVQNPKELITLIEYLIM